jgi:glycine/D-amino acid oxidase-like deaminating enzyme
MVPRFVLGFVRVRMPRGHRVIKQFFEVAAGFERLVIVLEPIAGRIAAARILDATAHRDSPPWASFIAARFP